MFIFICFSNGFNKLQSVFMVDESFFAWISMFPIFFVCYRVWIIMFVFSCVLIINLFFTQSAHPYYNLWIDISFCDN